MNGSAVVQVWEAWPGRMGSAAKHNNCHTMLHNICRFAQFTRIIQLYHESIRKTRNKSKSWPSTRRSRLVLHCLGTLLLDLHSSQPPGVPLLSSSGIYSSQPPGAPLSRSSTPRHLLLSFSRMVLLCQGPRHLHLSAAWCSTTAQLRPLLLAAAWCSTVQLGLNSSCELYVCELHVCTRAPAISSQAPSLTSIGPIVTHLSAL